MTDAVTGGVSAAGPGELYRGEVPHGVDGDEVYRQRIGTAVLFTGDDERDLDRAELNELLGYLGFNLWDSGAAATPAPAGIPGPECLAFGAVQAWQRYPALIRLITEAVGADGVRAIGGTARREIGTKVNAGHIWGAGAAAAFGRGLAMSLGQLAGHERERDLADVCQFMRRLAHGLWGGPDQPLFASMRGNRLPVLEDAWPARFAEERTSVTDVHRGFAEAADRTASLLHFGSGCGRQHSGPYPNADGGFVIVRDVFLSDELYHWSDACDELPHAVTLALFFAAGGPLPPIRDSGASGPVPLDQLTGVAAYARNRPDSPDVRPLDVGELDALRAGCGAASDRLERRIGAMSRRDRVMAGGQVRYLDRLVPFARAAGIWPRLRDELDAPEWDPVASEAYYQLIPGGVAAEMVPRLVASGAGFPPVKDAISGEEAFPALHLLALRGSCQRLPVDPNDLTSAGLVAAEGGGYVLTDAGRNVHQRQLANERATYETGRFEQAYERFVAQDAPMRAVLADWQGLGDGDHPSRGELLHQTGEILSQVRVALRRTNEQLLRFEGYLPRLRKALARAEQGEYEYLAGPEVDSVNTIWRELNTDYLLTQGLPVP